MPVERGISIALGMGRSMRRASTPRASATPPRSDTPTGRALAAEALDEYQALYVHIKGPDVPAHDGRARGQARCHQRDRSGVLRGRCSLGSTTGTIVAVTADHATSCVRKAHTADPVPLVVSGRPITADGTDSLRRTPRAPMARWASCSVPRSSASLAPVLVELRAKPQTRPRRILLRALRAGDPRETVAPIEREAGVCRRPISNRTAIERRRIPGAGAASRDRRPIARSDLLATVP